MKDLCQCPICGKETELQNVVFPDGKTRFYVECSDEKCKCRICAIYQKEVVRKFNAEDVEVSESWNVKPVYIPLAKRQAKIYSQGGGSIEQITYQNEIDASYSWNRKTKLWEAQNETQD